MQRYGDNPDFRPNGCSIIATLLSLILRLGAHLGIFGDFDKEITVKDYGDASQ